MARPTGPWVLVKVYGTQDQREFSNEFWYSITSGSPSPTWSQLAAAQAFYGAIVPTMVAGMTTDARIIGCELYYHDGTGTIGTAYYHITNGSSLLSGVPEDVAVIVQKKTANFTKKGRGRWFFAGVSQTQINNSYLNSTGITTYTAFAVALKTVVTDQGITYSPAHYSPGLGTLIPLTDTPVVALLATQRERKFGF